MSNILNNFSFSIVLVIVTKISLVACEENPSETVLSFLYIYTQPHFDIEPDYIIKKPMKRRFQWYIVRTEIFSTFHARVGVEYHTSFHPFKPMAVSAHRQTHTQWKHKLCQCLSIHLADIIISLKCTILEPESWVWNSTRSSWSWKLANMQKIRQTKRLLNVSRYRPTCGRRRHWFDKLKLKCI